MKKIKTGIWYKTKVALHVSTEWRHVQQTCWKNGNAFRKYLLNTYTLHKIKIEMYKNPIEVQIFWVTYTILVRKTL